MVQVEAPSTPECQQSVTSHPRCSVRGIHWTMNRTMNKTMNRTMNKTMSHEPWTINKGLTLSTIRSSYYFFFNIFITLCTSALLCLCIITLHTNVTFHDLLKVGVVQPRKAVAGFCHRLGRLNAFFNLQGEWGSWGFAVLNLGHLATGQFHCAGGFYVGKAGFKCRQMI